MFETENDELQDHELLDDESHDTEITLSTGKLLGIFFGLVLLCSLFFTMGYLLGRNSGSASKADATDVASEPAVPATSAKPSAVNKNSDAAPLANTAPVPYSQPSQPVATNPPAVASNSAQPALVPASSSGTGVPDASTAGASPATYMVQVAAVSKREDADLLVSALQKKQYPAFVGTAPGDTLFHVKVGPFTDPREAEAMRIRLANDGYNAIVKK